MARLGRTYVARFRRTPLWFFTTTTIASADTAVGAGTAFGATVEISPSPNVATATGGTFVPTVHVVANAGIALGSGAALDAVALTGPTVIATAGIALGQGQAQGERNVPRLIAKGSGLALDPHSQIAPNVPVTVGSGLILPPSTGVAPSPTFVIGSGTALSPRSQVSPTTPLVSAAGGVLTPTATVQPQPAASTGSGSSPNPSTGISPTAGLSSGSGSALTPTVQTLENPLGRWILDIPNASTTPVNVFAIGDSITEGLNGSADGGDKLTDRWLYRWAELARARHGLPSGGLGYISLLPQFGSNPSRTNGYFTSAANFSGASVTFGDLRAFAHQSWTLAAGDDLTLHWVGTSFKLQYALGQAAFTVRVDGGSAVTVTPAAGSTYQGWYQPSVTPSHGSHTAVIHSPSGAALKILGAFIYDGDETSGIHVWDNSQSGIGAVVGTGVSGPETTYTPTDQLATGACVDPSLVFLSLGMNDFAQQMSTSSFITAMESLIQMFDPTKVNPLVSRWPAIAMIAPHQYNADGPFAMNPTWVQYQAAYNTIKNDYSNHVAFIDISTYLAAPTAANSYDNGKVNSDEVHLRTLGNQFQASTIDAVVQ